MLKIGISIYLLRMLFNYFQTAQFIQPDLTPDLYDIINLEDLEQDDIDWQKWLFALNTTEKSKDMCMMLSVLTRRTYRIGLEPY
jgi:hypothetical protein